MIVRFDYLNGPVLGHRRRCEILRQALIDAGHDISEVGRSNDWLVVDYPPEDFPPGIKLGRRLVMGVEPIENNDWGWHPLASVAKDRMLVGREYLILDPRLENFKGEPVKQGSVLITCGGADPYHITEKLIELLPGGNVVIGPNFGRKVNIPVPFIRFGGLGYEEMMLELARHETVVCAWGMTVFEALALGARVIPITFNEVFAAEARALGITAYPVGDIPAILPAGEQIEVDLRGAQRTVRFMEEVL